jgi:hypothetical protein
VAELAAAQEIKKNVMGVQENVSNIVNWTGSLPKSGGRRGSWVLCSRMQA